MNVDAQLDRVFLHELEVLCSYAAEAAQVLSQPRDPALFRSLDSIPNFAGRAAQILWPTQGDKDRGQRLRKLLKVGDNSILADKRLRNLVEHFDERIDRWAKESSDRNVIHRLVGGRNAVGGSAIGGGDILRHWIPEEHIYALRGEEFDISAILGAMSELASKIQATPR
jgi:hypothetical protein